MKLHALEILCLDLELYLPVVKSVLVSEVSFDKLLNSFHFVIMATFIGGRGLKNSVNTELLGEV